MADTRHSFEELMSDLKRLRDELRVQIHLGSKEAQEEFDELEQRWDQMMKEGQPLAEAVADTARGVGTAAELAAGELKQGYEKIRKLLE